MWRGLDLLRCAAGGRACGGALDPGPLVVSPGHRDRVLAGEPPQPRRDDAVTAANKLATREREQARLEAQEALDDPLEMAGRRLAGEAFAGEVTGRRDGVQRGQAASPRPAGDGPHGRPGRIWRSAPRCTARWRAGPSRRSTPGARATACWLLRILDKMGRRQGARARVPVPEKGDRVCFTLFEHEQRGWGEAARAGGDPRGRTAARRVSPRRRHRTTVTEEDVL
ncbi:hypothetical protein GCM10017687_38190 [Streptomyces echinatus]